LDLFLKYEEDGTWRATDLELGGEWVSEKIALCVLFVSFQGIIENQLEVGGIRRGSSVSVRHENGK
jgi:hypothetical protein